MEENQLVGYRFHPTDEELVNHYLKNKILGKLWVINKINEININSHEPDSFPSLSKIKSNDRTYYFFAPTVYVSEKKASRKRSTRSGYWKPTGTDRIIKDKSGNKIGEKKTLVYHLGKVNNGVRTSWVMHEYLIKCWSHPDPESYVICKIKDKREDGNIPSGSDPSQSLVSASIIITTPLQIEQAVEEENGLALGDLEPPMPIMNEQDEELNLNTHLLRNDLGIPMIEPEVPVQPALNNDVIFDPLDENTWFNDQELEMQAHHSEIKDKREDGGDIGEPSQTVVADSIEIEQAVEEENGLEPPMPIMNEQDEEFNLDTFFDGLFENNLAMPIMNEPEVRSLQDFSDPNTNNPNVEELQAPYDVAQNNDVTWDQLEWFINQEEELVMQEHCNDHKPRKPLSGTIDDYSSDSDSEEAESISVTSYQGTLSSSDSSDGSSSNKQFPSCRDETLSSPTFDASIGKTEKKGLFFTEEAMEKTNKNSNKIIYLMKMKMIIGLILLLAFIGSIVSVLASTVKT